LVRLILNHLARGLTKTLPMRRSARADRRLLAMLDYRSAPDRRDVILPRPVATGLRQPGFAR
jgi:hypothetical protein